MDTEKSEWYTLEVWAPSNLGWVPLFDRCYNTEAEARTALSGYYRTDAVVRIVKSTKEVVGVESRTYPRSEKNE